MTAQDSILWNGTKVSEAQALAALRLVETRVPEPETQIAPEAGASYEKTARLMRLVDVSGVTKVGFVGNERYRNFERD
ncbi:hypothetical protein A6F65_00309 [Paraurantiacibacter namhicola]|uniref:Uncharacterized protein n=1 Tax=Paraurantiacibacter namhicola TaxID=645517 RepID=A0A1C7D580_9SPHN|nr:hypothetical protein A6F65_00309 [Paraurantiacibacter namhicola]